MNKKYVFVLLVCSSLGFAQQTLKTENYEKYATTKTTSGKIAKSINEGLFAENLMAYPGYGTTQKHFVIGELGALQNIYTNVSKEENILLVSFILNLSKIDEKKEFHLLDLKVPTSMYKGNSFVQLAVKNVGKQFVFTLADSNNPENKAYPANTFNYNEDHLVVLKISNFNTIKAACELFTDEDITNLTGSIAKLQDLKLPANKEHENGNGILFTAVLHQSNKTSSTEGKVGLLKISRGKEKDIQDLVNTETTKLAASQAKQGILQLSSRESYKNAEIKIYNAAGNVVQLLSNINTVGRGVQEIRINPLNQGLYIFTIKDAQNQYQTKFIVK